METIYICGEGTTRKGAIYGGSAEDAAQTDDCFLWGEGSREELIQQAIEQISASGYYATGAFSRLCSRSVLAYLGGPDVEFCEATRDYATVLGTIDAADDFERRLILVADTIYCETDGGREAVNAPKAASFAEALAIVSQIYSGADWALQLAR